MALLLPTALFIAVEMAEEIPELPEWNVRPIADLKGSDMHWSTVVEVQGKAKCIKGKDCALCNEKYSGGPCTIECHLDAKMKPREVSACTPTTDSGKIRLEAILMSRENLRYSREILTFWLLINCVATQKLKTNKKSKLVMLLNSRPCFFSLVVSSQIC